MCLDTREFPHTLPGCHQQRRERRGERGAGLPDSEQKASRDGAEFGTRFTQKCTSVSLGSSEGTVLCTPQTTIPVSNHPPFLLHADFLVHGTTAFPAPEGQAQRSRIASGPLGVSQAGKSHPDSQIKRRSFWRFKGTDAPLAPRAPEARPLTDVLQ